MHTLSNGTVIITPDQINGYESSSESGTIVERILGSVDVAVTLRPASLRSGTMQLVLGVDETAAADAEIALRGASVWTLNTAGDRLTVDMTFVVKDRVRRILDPATSDVWLVEFGWQEIIP